MREVAFNFHTGPSHGWLEVSHDHIARFLADGGKISAYSYIDIKGGRYFLEEDCDAPRFDRWWTRKHGKAPTICWHDMAEEGKIRRFPRIGELNK